MSPKKWVNGKTINKANPGRTARLSQKQKISARTTRKMKEDKERSFKRALKTGVFRVAKRKSTGKEIIIPTEKGSKMVEDSIKKINVKLRKIEEKFADSNIPVSEKLNTGDLGDKRRKLERVLSNLIEFREGKKEPSDYASIISAFEKSQK